MRLTLMRAPATSAAEDQSPTLAGVPSVRGIKLRQTAAGHRDDELTRVLPDLLPRLWRFALRLTGDQHTAEDLVQRSCVRGLERRHQLQPGTSPCSWMFSIVHSVWLNEVRARQIRRYASMQWNDELAETIPDESPVDPEQDLMHRQIIEAVEKLPDAQRAVMLLVAVEGLSYKEAAEALGIPMGTVMSRLARARLTIGQAFAREPGQTTSVRSQERVRDLDSRYPAPN
jgi:RNA polymerase sigma-70 factor (ECF subfamily)